MKKIKLLAIALVMGTVSMLANSDNPVVSKDEIKKQITELIEVAGNTIENETVIDVEFTFGTKGEIVVLKVNSRDRKVLAFIRENLNGKVLENPGKVYKKYRLPITIK